MSGRRFSDDDLYRGFIDSICRVEVRYAHEVRDGAIEVVFAEEGGLGRVTLLVTRREVRRLVSSGGLAADTDDEALAARVKQLGAGLVQAILARRPDERFLVVHEGRFVGSVRPDLPPQSGIPEWTEDLVANQGGKWWPAHDEDLRTGPPGLLEPEPGSTPDRATQIKAMSEVMDYGRYVFCVVDSAAIDIEDIEPLIRLQEEDATTVVVTQQVADDHGWPYKAVLAMVMLPVQVVPNAIDVTADITSALTERGISCRVVAGLCHDRLFIPHHRTLETLKALSDLQTMTW